MAQIFHHSTNTIARVSIYGAVILIAIAGIRRERRQSTLPTSPKCTTRGRSPFRSATNITWVNLGWIAAIAIPRWKSPPRRECLRRKPA